MEALAKYSGQSFDLILLDIMLPQIDGFGVCEVIRQKSDVPIIMLTALDDEGNQLKYNNNIMQVVFYGEAVNKCNINADISKEKKLPF